MIGMATSNTATTAVTKVVEYVNGQIHIYPSQEGYMLTPYNGTEILEYISFPEIYLPVDRGALQYAQSLKIISVEQDMRYKQFKDEAYTMLVNQFLDIE